MAGALSLPMAEIAVFRSLTGAPFVLSDTFQIGSKDRRVLGRLGGHEA